MIGSMVTSKTFVGAIDKVLKKHQLLELFYDRENVEHFYVKLVREPYMPLSIERHGSMIAIAHNYEQNGDLMSDPDVQFENWEAVNCTQGIFFSQKYAYDAEGKVKGIYRNFERGMKSFLAMWGRNIISQKWHELSEIESCQINGEEVNHAIRSNGQDS